MVRTQSKDGSNHFRIYQKYLIYFYFLHIQKIKKILADIYKNVNNIIFYEYFFASHFGDKFRQPSGEVSNCYQDLLMRNEASNATTDKLISDSGCSVCYALASC